MMINHEWDTSKPLEDIAEALKEYLESCYGKNAVMPSTQVKEVSQAFLSGIHWLNCKSNWSPGEYEAALRLLLGMNKR